MIILIIVVARNARNAFQQNTNFQHIFVYVTAISVCSASYAAGVSPNPVISQTIFGLIPKRNLTNASTAESSLDGSIMYRSILEACTPTDRSKVNLKVTDLKKKSVQGLCLAA